MDPPTSKRKRSGKAREEAKARAIALAEKAAEAEAETETRDDARGQDDEGEQDQEQEQEQEEQEDPTDPIPSLDLLQKRIPQALKSLHPILKRARTAETQRVIRKMKALRGKAGEGKELAELEELEGQMEALKTLDLQHTIPPLLNLKLRKHPALRPLLPLPETLFPQAAAATALDPATAEGKARNRVWSAKGVGEQVAGVVAWCIGLEGGKLKTPGKGKAKGEVKGKDRERMEKPTERERQVKGDGQGVGKERVVGGSAPGTHDDEEDDLAQDAAADAAGWESGSVRSDEDGSLPDSDSDSGSDDSDAAHPPPKRARTTLSASPPPRKSAKRSTADTSSSSSLFLPTLASGFTMGSYDSDPDEDDRRDKKSGKAGLVQSVRKNRRGQAERRKIWEQKYGKGANHVKKQQEVAERQVQDSRFLTSQMGGAAGNPKSGDRRRETGSAVRDEGWQRRPARAAPAPAAAAAAPKPKPAPKPATTVTGTEHPSWIAAKLRKEREMAGMGGVGGAVKPKKIVFD